MEATVTENLGLRAAVACLIASLWVAQPAAALDFGQPEKINDAFNTVAKVANLKQRMVLRECRGSPPSVCMLGLPGKVSVLASADATDPNRTRLIVLAADRSSEPKQFIEDAMWAMFAYSPNRDANELKSAFSVLFQPPLKDFRIVEVKGVKFALRTIDDGAVFFTIKDAALPDE